MSHSSVSRERGFTIVELLVAMTLSAIIVGSMMVLFMGQMTLSRMAGPRIEVIQRARFTSELLRREISLAGAGMPNAQPMVVYAGPNDLIFSVDLTSSTAGDRIAVYQIPGAPLTETEGADSGSMVLPNAEDYPRAWYGGSLTGGPAETIHFSFVDTGAGTFAFVRSVNGLEGDTLLRELRKLAANEFFSYEVMEAAGGLRSIASGPIWHEAPIHDSDADTAGSAQTDSLKLVHLKYTLRIKGSEGQDIDREFSTAVALKNAGLISNFSCGDAPELGVVPGVTPNVAPPTVEITWPPAVDEVGGEEDIYQYTIYRRLLSETVPRPIASFPPDGSVSYSYVDTDVILGETYVYYLGASDCTPTQSDLAESAAVTVI